MKKLANTCLLTSILFFCICIQGYSQKKVGDSYKGGVLFEIYGDGSGGKVFFAALANSYDVAHNYIKDLYENDVKCYMANDYDLQTLFELKLIGPDRGDGSWSNFWWMGEGRMYSYGKPFMYPASMILDLPKTSLGYDRTAKISNSFNIGDRYDSKCYYAIVGRVSWPKGSNVYKPTAEEIKQAQIDEKKRLEQAIIDEKNRLEQAIIEEKKRLEQAKIDEKNRLEQAIINEKNRLEQAKQARIKTIGTPIKIFNFEVAENDFPGGEKMTWEDAKKACDSLGDGWRLPTKDELNILYLNRTNLNGFKDSYSYWSSTEDGNLTLLVSFMNGPQVTAVSKSRYGWPVRAIRTINRGDSAKESIFSTSYKQKVIGTTIMINNLEVAQFDFAQQMDWDLAKLACEALGDGWRLPTKKELNVLHRNQSKVWGSERGGKGIWSSTEEYSNKMAWILRGGGDGNQETIYKGRSAYVRAVRSF